MKISSTFYQMVSIENLFHCWRLFKRGKSNKEEVQLFAYQLEDNIFQLHDKLMTNNYHHGPYRKFKVFDPKERLIHAASVKDRLIHQMIYSALTEFFDHRFIFHSLSCRIGKGTHAGIIVLRKMILKVSSNNKKRCYALKMDIKRFFDSVDTSILKTLIRKQVQDEKILQIIDMIIDSFFHTKTADKTSGIPLGNLTSQIFANIYLHELDLFIKHKLKEQFYLRYCDDFIILSKHKERLQALIPIIQNFLTNQLHLQLHPKKISIRPLKQGIDFIGYVLYPKHTLIRPKTKKRALKRLRKCAEMGKANINQTLQSYLGILSHCHQYTFSQTLKNVYG